MLRHEESDYVPVSTVHHRVTPKELTRALSAIEARKQEAAQRQEAEQAYLNNTIPVDEAVRELRLEATPEEIWAEVQAQRAAEPTEEAAPEAYVKKVVLIPSPRKLSKSQIITGLLATTLIGFTVFLCHRHNPVSVLTPTISVTNAATSDFSVANFPNAVPFELSADSLQGILRGEDTSKIGVDPNVSYDTNVNWGWWSLVKYDGHVYVRGYVPAPPTEDSLPTHLLDIDNTYLARENGNRPAEVTLRLDTLKFCSFYERISVPQTPYMVPGTYAIMDEKITVSDVHLDQHTWERARYVMSTKEPTVQYVFPNHPMKTPNRLPKPDMKWLRGEAVIPLSSYPDEKPFTLSYGYLAYLLTSASSKGLYIPSKQLDLTRSGHWGNWDLVKHQDHLYLRGWVAGDTTQGSIAGQFLYLYNVPTPPELGGSAKQISLRLGNFQYGARGVFYQRSTTLTEIMSDTTIMEQQIPLTGVRLDDHAWEKWQP